MRACVQLEAPVLASPRLRPLRSGLERLGSVQPIRGPETNDPKSTRGLVGERTRESYGYRLRLRRRRDAGRATLS